ncbi:MAG: helix-turn-helix transcriptional regulator [Pseudomonadota bacterium]
MISQKLTDSLIRTISDPSAWHVALSQICEATLTPKALISLRDPKTAQIVVPEDVSVDFASPLIYGFSAAEVESYLGEFAALDPWTDVERAHYPYFPYAMSRYLPARELKKTAFWDWLEPQGISECVVCELGRTDAYWAALNLYFDGSSELRVRAVIDRLREMHPVLKSTWSSCRAFQIAQSSEGAFGMVLDAMDKAAALVARDGQLVAANSEFQEQIDGAVIGKRLTLPASLALTSEKSMPDVSFARGRASDVRLSARIASFYATELAGGEARELFLLTLMPFKDQLEGTGRLVWDSEDLTDRERTLVRLVAQGQTFRQAQAEMDLSYPRIMQLWKSARLKLDIENVTDLRLAYRLSQKSQDYSQV